MFSLSRLCVVYESFEPFNTYVVPRPVRPCRSRVPCLTSDESSLVAVVSLTTSGAWATSASRVIRTGVWGLTSRSNPAGSGTDNRWTFRIPARFPPLSSPPKHHPEQLLGTAQHIVFSIHQTKYFIYNHCNMKYNFINNKFCGRWGVRSYDFNDFEPHFILSENLWSYDKLIFVLLLLTYIISRSTPFTRNPV